MKSTQTPAQITANTLKAVFLTAASAALLATLFTAWPVAGLVDNINTLGQDAFSVAATETAQPNFHVGLVVGHWGFDSGAVCSEELGGYKEVNLNHTIAEETRKVLQSYDVKVDLLKEFDERLEGYQAQALVSIHADTCEFTSEDQTGFKIQDSQENQRPDQAARLLQCMKTRYGSATSLKYDEHRISVDMTDYHAFRTIDPNTPAIIIETGYMNLDRDLLVNHPDLVGRGIAEGILCYLYRQPISQGE